MHFKANPYFSNKVITKEYKAVDGEVAAEVTEVQWKDAKVSGSAGLDSVLSCA